MSGTQRPPQNGYMHTQHPCFTPDYQISNLKGELSPNLLSEMSLPRIAVLIEKLFPKILGRLEKENRSKRRCKVAFVQCKCAVMLSVSVQFLYATHN